jgi:hypothetical protein
MDLRSFDLCVIPSSTVVTHEETETAQKVKATTLTSHNYDNTAKH